MNDVINPFQITYPSAIQTSLFATALFAKFDPTGRWVAAGRQNGSVAIWDLETKAPVRALDGHVRGLTSVDWSRHARYVLTSSKDWNVIVWDLASKYEPMQRLRTIRFDSPVVSAEFHPKNSKIIIALLSTGEVFITDTRKEHRGRAELCDNTLTNHHHPHHHHHDIREREEGEEESLSSSLPPSQNATKRSPITVARFDISGRYVFAGTANGMLLVFNTRTKAMVGRHKVAGVGTMKSLDFTKNGRRLVTNSSDRILRQFTIPNYQQAIPDKVNEQELEPTHRFNDPINRTAWHVMSYSPDGEWLAGGSADPATHKIYIWDLANDGRFATALDGGREPLAHIHWHPAKSLIASTTTHGNVLIWHCPKAERWGAFAGGFEEVDENIEYEEKEGEFDVEDEETIQERKMKAEEQEVDVDTMDLSPDSSSPIVPKRTSNNSMSAAAGVAASTSGSKPTSSTSKPPSSTSTSNSQSKAGPKSPTTTTTTDNVSSGNGNVKASGKESGGGKKGGAGGKNVDEDVAWAEEDPDEDVKGWKMRVGKAGVDFADELGA